VTAKAAAAEPPDEAPGPRVQGVGGARVRMIHQESGSCFPDCGNAHRPGAGRLDERERRLSHEEHAAARRLTAEGHDVRSNAERRGSGPVADLTVCGLPVEVKTLVAQAERPGGRAANARSVHNRLCDAIYQAPLTIVQAEGSGLTAADAVAGVRSFARRGRVGEVRAVRVVGDGFDLSWRLVPERSISRPAQPYQRAAPRDPPSLGLP
jgi:hypothetical protein